MTSRVFFAVLVVATLASVEAGAYSFLGWHPSGAFYFQTVRTPPQMQVCREDTTDIPTGWPEGVNVGPGVSCGDLPATVEGKPAADYAKKAIAGAKFDKKSGFGLDVKIESKDKTHTVFVVNGDKKQQLAQLEHDGALKVTDQFWRNDGLAVVVTLKSEKDKTATFEAHGNIASLLVGGPAGRKRAERLYADGQKLMKKRDWSGAGRILEDAIVADPTYAPVRYARAAAEAQGGVGRTAMIENLTWLKDNGEKDKSAKKLLDQAKADAAFDAWVGEPEVRDLLGMPKVSSMDVPARILERKATWSVQGSTCKSPWLTLAFKGDPKKNGTVTLTAAESCKGKKVTKTAPGVWRQSAAGPYEVEFKKLPDGLSAPLAFPLKANIVLDESYQQMKLTPESGETVGPFEPGVARTDDSTL